MCNSISAVSTKGMGLFRRPALRPCFQGRRIEPTTSAMATRGQFVLPGIQHADGPNQPAVQKVAEEIIRKMLGILCFGPPPAPPPQPTDEQSFPHQDPSGSHYTPTSVPDQPPLEGPPEASDNKDQ